MGDLLPFEISELEEVIEKITKFYSPEKQKFVMFEPGAAGQTVYHADSTAFPVNFLLRKR